MPREQARTVERIVGERLRRLRNEHGLSQAALGRKLNVSFQQIQKYETGENRIGPSRMLSLASVLGVPVSYFLEDLDDAGTASPRTPPDMPARVLSAAQRLYRIRNTRVRNSLLTLIWTLGEEDAARRR